MTQVVKADASNSDGLTKSPEAIGRDIGTPGMKSFDICREDVAILPNSYVAGGTRSFDRS